MDKIKLFKKHKKKGPQFKKRNKIYLQIKNLKSKRPLKKLDHIKVGPFLINKQPPILDKSTRKSYRLKLSIDACIHSVFHISLLKPADLETLLQKTFYFQPNKG